MAVSMKGTSLAQRRAELKLAEAMVGRRVVKDFGPHGLFRGEVEGITNIPDQRPHYRIRYEDGDAEDVTHLELHAILIKESQSPRQSLTPDDHAVGTAYVPEAATSQRNSGRNAASGGVAGGARSVGVARRWKTSDAVTAAAASPPPAFIDASQATPPPVARHVLRNIGSSQVEPLTPPKDAALRQKEPTDRPQSNDSSTAKRRGGQSPSRSSSLASRVSQQRQRSADSVAISSAQQHRGQSQPGGLRCGANGSGVAGSGAERHAHSISPRRPRVPPTASDAGFPNGSRLVKGVDQKLQHSPPGRSGGPPQESPGAEAKHSPYLRSEVEEKATGTATRASRSSPRRPPGSAAAAGFPSRLMSPGAPSAVASEKQTPPPSTPPQQHHQQHKELHRSWPKKPPAPTSAPPASTAAPRSAGTSSSTGEGKVPTSPWAVFLNRGPVNSQSNQSSADSDSPSTPMESKAAGERSLRSANYRSRRATAASVLTGPSSQEQKPRWTSGADPDGQPDPVTSPIVRANNTGLPQHTERRQLQHALSPPAAPPPHAYAHTPPPAPPPSFARMSPSLPAATTPASSGKLPKPPLPTTAPPPPPTSHSSAGSEGASSPASSSATAAAARRADLLRAAHTKFATPVSPSGSSRNAERKSTAPTTPTGTKEAEAATAKEAAAASIERHENGGAASSMSGHSRASSSDMPETEVPEPGNLSEQSHEDVLPNPVAAVRSAMMTSSLKTSNAALHHPPPHHRSSLSPTAAHRRRGGTHRSSNSPPEGPSLPPSLPTASATAAAAAAAAAAAVGSSNEDNDALALMEGFLAAVAAGANEAKSSGLKRAASTTPSSVASAAAAHLVPLHNALAGALQHRTLAAQTFERVLVEEQAVLDAAAAQRTLLEVRKKPAASVKGQLLTKYQDAHVVLLEQVASLAQGFASDLERREQASSSHAAAVARADAEASAQQECEKLRAAVRSADQRASQAEARLAAQAANAAQNAYTKHEEEYAKQRANVRAVEEAHQKEVADLKAALAAATARDHPQNGDDQASVQDLTTQLEAAEKVAAATTAKNNSLQERLKDALASLEAANRKANRLRSDAGTNTVPTDEVADLRNELEIERTERAQETASALQKMKALAAQLERELNKGSARAQVQLLTDLDRCQQERESDRVQASIEIARLESNLAGERALRDAGLKAAADELRELTQQHQQLLEQFSPEQVQQFQASRGKSSRAASSGSFDVEDSGHENNHSTAVKPGANSKHGGGEESVEELSSLVTLLRSDLAKERQRRTELIAAHEARVEQLSKDLAFAVEDVTAVRNSNREAEDAAAAQIALLQCDLEKERTARLAAESSQSEQVVKLQASFNELRSASETAAQEASNTHANISAQLAAEQSAREQEVDSSRAHVAHLEAQIASLQLGREQDQAAHLTKELALTGALDREKDMRKQLTRAHEAQYARLQNDLAFAASRPTSANNADVQSPTSARVRSSPVRSTPATHTPDSSHSSSRGLPPGDRRGVITPEVGKSGHGIDRPQVQRDESPPSPRSPRITFGADEVRVIEPYSSNRASPVSGAGENHENNEMDRNSRGLPGDSDTSAVGGNVNENTVESWAKLKAQKRATRAQFETLVESRGHPPSEQSSSAATSSPSPHGVLHQQRRSSRSSSVNDVIHVDDGVSRSGHHSSGHARREARAETKHESMQEARHEAKQRRSTSSSSSSSSSRDTRPHYQRAVSSDVVLASEPKKRSTSRSSSSDLYTTD